MADEGRGIALVILGIVAIVAVIGLVLMFAGPGVTGRQAGPVATYGGQTPGDRTGIYRGGAIVPAVYSGEYERAAHSQACLSVCEYVAPDGQVVHRHYTSKCRQCVQVSFGVTQTKYPEYR